MSTGTLSISLGGRVATLKSDDSSAEHRGGGKRGVVKEFSKAARRRMMRLTQSIDRRAVHVMPLFLHLTYPEQWPEEPERYHRDLDTFLKRLLYDYPEASAIWKLEFQARGAPHFHLMIFGIRFIPWQWIANSWFLVVGSKQEEHLHAGTKIERVRSWRGVAWYVSKYMCKDSFIGPLLPPGRFWGVHNRQGLPVTWFLYAVSASEFIWLKRTLRRYAKANHFQFGGFSQSAGGTLFLPFEVALKLVSYVYYNLSDREIA